MATTNGLLLMVDYLLASNFDSLDNDDSSLLVGKELLLVAFASCHSFAHFADQSVFLALAFASAQPLAQLAAQSILFADEVSSLESCFK